MDGTTHGLQLSSLWPQTEYDFDLRENDGSTAASFPSAATYPQHFAVGGTSSATKRLAHLSHCGDLASMVP